MTEIDAVELYRKYRPSSLEQVVGQDKAVSLLRGWLTTDSLPQVLMFSGPSGCGKTTMARILRKAISCGDSDYHELDAASYRGIDTIRKIQDLVQCAPLSGDKSVWLLDECHQLTTQASESMLKMLEDTPRHAHFFLATTNPEKLKQTVKTRVSAVPLVHLSSDALRGLIKNVLLLEGKKVSKEVGLGIVEASNGSARLALVTLQRVLAVSDENQRLEIVRTANHTASEAVISLCRALLQQDNWTTISKLIVQIDDEPESCRHAVLAYMCAVLAKKKNDQAFRVLECFSDNWFDSKKAGLFISSYASIFGE